MYEDFVPERIAQLRTKKGVSARDMSLSLGQANNYINNIENKKSLPAMQSFFYICEYLGVTPKEFFDDENADPTALREFIQEARRLDEKSLEYILGIMKKLNRQKMERTTEACCPLIFCPFVYATLRISDWIDFACSEV